MVFNVRERLTRSIWKIPEQRAEVVDWTWPADWANERWERGRAREEERDKKNRKERAEHSLIARL